MTQPYSRFAVAFLLATACGCSPSAPVAVAPELEIVDLNENVAAETEITSVAVTPGVDAGMMADKYERFHQPMR
ncbi:hypothetical protein [Allorhodopirellula heiligendammensis]|uniref:Uncharacterized protein n=1 Tax=Allorhodopirellula heiligendammensis TaxID=2714739 RepID=A0A5C6B1W9_9BACT|nr:hypothetical protein [Allorhodopirellula heiligendammensis]TWU05412.1 hypothetical protein Poly21_56760 [Allorhodopirellula heiligendammensis]